MLCCNNNMLRLNKAKRFNQTFGARTCSRSHSDEKVKRYTAHVRSLSARIIHTHADFEQVDIPEKSMIYVDPPYSQHRSR